MTTPAPISLRPMNALADDAELRAFAAEWAQRLEHEARRLHEFSIGPVFGRMREALLARSEEAGFGDEDLAYFRSETRARLGWQNESDEDVDDFVRVVVDPQGSGVLPGSVTEDADCSFGNVSFVSHGLAVRMLFGQGTSWFVRVPGPAVPQAFSGSKD